MALRWASTRGHGAARRGVFGVTSRIGARRHGVRSVALAAAIVVGLTAAACSSDGGDRADRGETTTSTSTPDTTDASDSDLVAPTVPGPYAVGRSTVQLQDDSRARPLTADVWYPADAGTTGTQSIYQFLPGIEFASSLALADVAVASDGPYPLVIYSHGSGGLRYVAAFFTELLASYGFVVASVDHVGNTAVESIGGTEPPRDQIAYDRVLDVDFLITQMLSASAAADGQFSGAIDPERIGVSGHSFGGFTALAAVSGYSNPLGTIPGDDRIIAAVGMAPATGLSSDEELQAVDVPTLLVSGTSDRTVTIAEGTERPWELVTGRPLWRVDLTEAGHQSFTDVCDYQRLLPTLSNVPQPLIDAVDDFAEEGCGPDLMPIDEAHDLINRSTISFLLAYVAGETDYVQFLEDEVDGETVQVKE